ncbi:MAG: RNA polymerase-binding protein DksA [Nitrospirota bacterium]|jgi:DnaK suppressor protein
MATKKQTSTKAGTAAKKKTAAKKPAKKTAKKPASKKAVAKKAATAKKKTAKKTTGKQSPSPKKSAKKTAAKKSAPAKAAKKGASKKSARRSTAEKTSPPSQGEKALTPREKRILEIRQNLIEQKEQILSEAESTMNSLPEPAVFPDLGDQASAETDRNFMLRLRGREQKLLNKIEEALERIEKGTFGICDVCGEEIEIARLQARPVATLCIDCKEEQEEAEKLQGH